MTHLGPRAGPRLGLGQRAEQQMLLLPRMLQSIEVLQLSSAELGEFVAQAIEENEALRVEGEERRPREPELRRGPVDRAATERHDEMLQNQPEREKSLAELVEQQLALVDVEPELLPWVRFVVGCLDANGYLAASDEALIALAREQGLARGGEHAREDEGRLGCAIGVVQKLEPRGIGGRDAVEALLLQLDPADPDYALLCALLEDFLEELAHNKLPAVARALGIDLARLQELLGLVRRLHLRPAAGLIEREEPTIRPEVIVERDGEGFTVAIEDSGLPAISIDPRIARIARDRAQPREVRAYLRDKLASARSIVDAVEQRRRTLMRIAALVFERQRAFLAAGPGHMAPLTMVAVAEELGLAVSTISRAVASKHVQTPWGIFALRRFFQGASGSEEGAREDVREIVRGVCAAEDAGRPLSDDEIVAEMRRRGFELARRTVAKYRHELGIPSSYRRRRHV